MAAAIAPHVYSATPQTAAATALLIPIKHRSLCHVAGLQPSTHRISSVQPQSRTLTGNSPSSAPVSVFTTDTLDSSIASDRTERVSTPAYAQLLRMLCLTAEKSKELVRLAAISRAVHHAGPERQGFGARSIFHLFQISRASQPRRRAKRTSPARPSRSTPRRAGEGGSATLTVMNSCGGGGQYPPPHQVPLPL